MKKLILFLLALILALAFVVPVNAENVQTDLTMVLTESYIAQIPSSLTFEPGTSTVTASFGVSNVRLDSGHACQLSLSPGNTPNGSTFYMYNTAPGASAYIGYSITATTEAGTSTLYGDPAVVGQYAADTTAVLTYTANTADMANAPSGTYKDTVTYYVSIVSANS